MKKLLLSAACSLSLISANSQTLTPIADARNQPDSSVVHITGTVQNGSELGKIRYIKDASGAAIGIYSPVSPLIDLVAGDSIDVIGAKVNYRNLIEVVKTAAVPLTITTLGSAMMQPVPTEYSAIDLASAFTEANEGKLITVTGLTAIVPTSGTPATAFAGNTNYNLNGDPTYQIRCVTTALTVVGLSLPTAEFSVTGILSQFCSDPVVGCTVGYQLLPRTADDITISQTAVSNSKLLREVTVYPNPTSIGSICINSESIISNVVVLDMLGNRIEASISGNQVELGNLSRGLYFINFSVGGMNRTQKVSVQ